MQLNLEHVDAEEIERIYIRQEGEMTLKVIKVTEGTTSNNNPQIKVHFQDKNGHWAIDDFVVTPNALWKIKILTKALKLPNIVDTAMFPNRYVKATFRAKKTENGEIFEIKKYEPSPLTNTMETQQARAPQSVPDYGAGYIAQQQQQGAGYQEPTQLGAPEDDDEIPF